MRNMSTKELTLTAVLSAIVLVMALVPNFGFITVTPFVGFTIIHIPILIGAFYGGRKVGGFLGALFGITSMFVAFTRPAAALDPIFTNPLVSILPRFLIGYFAVDVLNLYKKWVSNVHLQNSLFFGTMTLLHSLLVIPLLYIAGLNYWYFDVYGVAEELTREGTLGTVSFISDYFIGGTGVFGFLVTLFILNSLLEIVMAVVVGVPVATRLESALDKQ